MKIDELKTNPKNPRHISQESLNKLKESISRDPEFMKLRPIVVDKDNTVLGGNQRLKAIKELDYKEVPAEWVAKASELTEEQKKRFILVDNAPEGMAGDWDADLLTEQWEPAKLEELGFDLDSLGIDIEEPTPGLTDPDEVPEEPEEPITQTGDLWQLGEHYLLCGDSTNANDVEKVLGQIKNVMMVTDPPYGVNYDADWRNKALRANGKPLGGRAVGKCNNDDNADWYAAWALFPGDVAYVWHAGNKAHIVAESLIQPGLEIIAQIVWAKNNIVIGRGNYHPKHEPCWYTVRKNGKRFFTDDRKQNTLWEIDKPLKSETGHSTQKPIECMARPIRNHNIEYIYEPFSGSGTTIIACEQLNRKCRAIEISPKYVDIAIQRWCDYTGKEAIRQDGKKWSELKNG